MLYDIIPQAKLPRNVNGAFTYQSKKRLNLGDLVVVEFRKTDVLGLVAEKIPGRSDKDFMSQQLGRDFMSLPARHNGWRSNTHTKQKAVTIKNIKNKIGTAPYYFVDLIKWASNYYFTSTSFIFDIMMPTMPKRHLSCSKTSLIKTFGKKFKNLKIHKSQLKRIKKILTDLNVEINTFNLIGSAKFIAYYKLIQAQIKNKQTTMLLCPTIADLKLMLTYLPQRWQDKTVLLYSDVYKGKNRYWNTWQKINNSAEALIVMGTRSAIFAPCKNLGLIIIDQAEQDNYKQYDQNPRYDARKVALKIKELTGCGVKMFTDGIYIM